MAMSKLVLPGEAALVAQRSVILEVGLVAAHVLQQIHHHIQSGHGESADGAAWMTCTQTALANELAISRDQVKAAVKAMRDRGWIVALQRGGYDRTAWLRIDYEMVDLSIGSERPKDWVSAPNGLGVSAPCTSTQRTNTSPEGGGDPLTLLASPEGLDQGEEPKATDDETNPAHYVAEYVAYFSTANGGRTPDREWRAACGRAARTALANGHDPGAIRACLNVAAQEGKSPTTLPHILTDYYAQRPRRQR